MVRKSLALLFAAALTWSCSGGSGSVGGGAFRLIEFLEAGRDSIPRNRILTFVFSQTVASSQDFAERLRIQNIQTGANSNFSKALGLYLVVGERVTFVPRLPEQKDRSDAGFRSDANYAVFLKGGPDALTSDGGDTISTQQEFLFNTGSFFEDPVPNEPPRAFGLVARDPTTQQTIELSRLDPRPDVQDDLDSATLIAANRVIEPGAGGGPNYATPWQFELTVSEPIDPATISTDNIEMFEIYSNATTSGDTAPPAAPANATPPYLGTPVSFKVPIQVGATQIIDATGTITVAIRVTPLFALIDNSRYRLRFSGSILGIDFRKSFIGENGLTGDGQTVLPGNTQPFAEPGGLGYVTEFIVRDRPSIQSRRMLTFDPLEDGISPEKGQTATDPAKFNSALYNPTSNPSRAVGFLPDFGDGSGGNISVGGGSTLTIDTGDTPNATIGNPFTVRDLNPNDEYHPSGIPGSAPNRTYDSYEYFDLSIASLTVSAGATLRTIGTNPILFRVSGVVQIAGRLDASGGDGADAGNVPAAGGVSGSGGGDGGNSKVGVGCIPSTSSCTAWGSFIQGGCSNIAQGAPYAENGTGPGRGMAGGDAWSYAYDNISTSPISGTTGTGGGGASHATAGTAGEDRNNVGGAPGTVGPACTNGTSAGYSASWASNSSIIGVRGQPGPLYGEREMVTILWGGSGGGAGGVQHMYTSFATGTMSGGGGGGGGGSLAVFAAGPIIVPGGTVDVSGGMGGKGSIANGYTSQSSWRQASGAGGGGSGGAMVLISGAEINVTGALLDARGGSGGPRADTFQGQPVTNCNGCNAGGGGGKGFIFLMDADGTIEGVAPGTPGNYDSYVNGVLTISIFKTDRFSSIAAVTELFNVLSANPEYLPMAPTDVLGVVASGQRIRVFASSARADAVNPLVPDLSTEISAFQVALVSYQAGAVTVTTGPTTGLNPSGTPLRDAFVRIDARFEYDIGVQAALGPFASLDVVVISFRFNG